MKEKIIDIINNNFNEYLGTNEAVLHAAEDIEDLFKKKIKIELHDYSYTCGDGCCTEYGTITKVNGVELDFRNTDTPTILRGVLEFLGYEVEIGLTYDYED